MLDVITKNPTFSLSVSTGNVNEDGSFTVFFNTIESKYLTPAGTTFYWEITGNNVSSADFLPGTSLQGDITLTRYHSSKSIIFNLKQDQTTEGLEVATFKIYADSARTVQVYSTNLAINDTSLTPTYNITPQGTNVNEGSNLAFSVVTTDIFNGTTLYWDLSRPEDFDIDYGQITITNNVATVTVTPTADVTNDNLLGGAEEFTVSLYTDSSRASEFLVATSTPVTINDTSLSPPEYSISVSSPYYYKKSSWSSATGDPNERQTITFNVNNVSAGTTFYWEYSPDVYSMMSQYSSSTTGVITNTSGNFYNSVGVMTFIAPEYYINNSNHSNDPNYDSNFTPIGIALTIYSDSSRTVAVASTSYELRPDDFLIVNPIAKESVGLAWTYKSTDNSKEMAMFPTYNFSNWKTYWYNCSSNSRFVDLSKLSYSAANSNNTGNAGIAYTTIPTFPIIDYASTHTSSRGFRVNKPAYTPSSQYGTGMDSQDFTQVLTFTPGGTVDSDGYYTFDKNSVGYMDIGIRSDYINSNGYQDIESYWSSGGAAYNNTNYEYLQGTVGLGISEFRLNIAPQDTVNNVNGNFNQGFSSSNDDDIVASHVISIDVAAGTGFTMARDEYYYVELDGSYYYKTMNQYYQAMNAGNVIFPAPSYPNNGNQFYHNVGIGFTWVWINDNLDPNHPDTTNQGHSLSNRIAFWSETFTSWANSYTTHYSSYPNGDFMPNRSFQADRIYKFWSPHIGLKDSWGTGTSGDTGGSHVKLIWYTSSTQLPLNQITNDKKIVTFDYKYTRT